MTEINGHNLVSSYQDFEILKQELLDKQASMESRLWLDSNLSKFDEVLRLNYDTTLEKFSENITEHIAQVMNAVHGAFFIIDKEEQLIKATGGYACTVETMDKSSFKFGQGIIGQSVRSKKTLSFDNMETRIDSSLGRLSATCLTVAPLIFNQEVYGVIEITTLHKSEPKEQELLERMCRNTASFLQSFISNHRTKHLLENSQQQTEELRSQEEELRQSMEELQATQEEMHRKGIELKGLVGAVNSTLATAEFDSRGRFMSTNAKFLEIMGYTASELLGKHHRILVEPKEAETQGYKTFWDTLRLGKTSISNDFRRFGKNSKEVWLSATYTPVLDDDGEVIKIIKLALDITAQKRLSLDYKWQMEAVNKSFAVIEFELNGTILKANDNFLNTVGYSSEEIVDKQHRLFVEATHQKSQEYINLWENLRKGVFQAGDFPRITKDGKTIWISGSYNPIFNADEKPYKVVKYVKDITQQKSYQSETSQYLHALKQVNFLIELDLDGNIQMVNDYFLEATGHERTAILGKPLHDTLAYKELIEKVKRGEKTTVEICYTTISGEILSVKSCLTPIYDLSNQPNKILIVT